MSKFYYHQEILQNLNTQNFHQLFGFSNFIYSFIRFGNSPYYD